MVDLFGKRAFRLDMVDVLLMEAVSVFALALSFIVGAIACPVGKILYGNEVLSKFGPYLIGWF